MQNELLSPVSAVVSFAAASAVLGLICRKAKTLISHENLAMMGLMGAFVFAGQMINVPILPGVSGHIIGAILVAILLGPYAASIVISSVVIVQCLVFQDGGIMAIGCNIINIAIVPSFVGYGIYRLFMPSGKYDFGGARATVAVIAACEIAVVLGALLVPIETAMAGVLEVPFKTFALTMAGVHSITGLLEGAVTVSVLVYIQRLYPAILTEIKTASPEIGFRKLYISMALITLVVAAGLSIFASQLPDGLEWSWAQHSAVQESASEETNRWTGFMMVTGSLMTMAGVWVIVKTKANHE
jgi:cobalt/nickel transport system permease protein